MNTRSKPARRMPAACLGIVLSLVCVTGSAAQDPPPPSRLTADEVVDRLVKMNQSRAEALRNYTSVRQYHVELNGLVHLRGDMSAKMTYRWPDQKEFTVISESGSEVMRKRVLKALLEAEQEAMQKENHERSTLSPENYSFTLAGVEGPPEQPAFYILNVTPKVINKFVYKGRIWVDAKDFAVVRVQAQPAKSPSWWTKRNDISSSYRKVGEFWLLARTESNTEVRIFGHTTLTIEYQDYDLIDARKLQPATENQDSPAPQGAR